ncbi:MAG: TraR/DksA C4-type zinc finger protein [Minisyncoccia bacterium]
MAPASNGTNTDRFKERLLAEKKKLETEMGGVGRRNPALPNDWESAPSEIGSEADLADQADVVISHESNNAILADLEARYDTILSALERIGNGTYGTCEVCGKSIEGKRLDADPAALTCVAHL